MSNSALGDSFAFRCTCCGDCCSGDMIIDINLYDLYKLAKRLGMKNSGELFSSGLLNLVKGQNGAAVPRIAFRTSPSSFCPWLINDLGDDGILRGFCSLHPHDKPLVCKMAPVSRVVDLDGDSEIFFLTSPTENCPGMHLAGENSLERLKTDLKAEMDYEKRYYAILEARSEADLDFYSFDCSRSFDEILEERE